MQHIGYTQKVFFDGSLAIKRRILQRIFLILMIWAGHAVVCLSHTLTFALTGDIMMGTTYPTRRLPLDGGRNLFAQTREILRKADVAVGNLEGPLCDEGELHKEVNPHKYAFRTPTAYGEWLADAGYDFLSMANNHAFDFGIKGVESTEQALQRWGIGYAGIAGRTEYAIIERHGVRIGLCAFGHNGYTQSHLYLKTVERTLQQLRQHADIIVVSVHGGAEGFAQSHVPDSMEVFMKEHRGYLRRLTHFCIDHGADVVYGHGPHVVRGIEVYHGRFIAYSLGNFCTPFGINIQGISSYAPIITVTTDHKGRFIKGKIYSFHQVYGIGPRFMPDRPQVVAHQIKALSETDFPKSDCIIDLHGNIRLLRHSRR